LLAAEALCSARRRKSMKHLQRFVNLLFSRFTLHLHALFCEGANYSKAASSMARTILGLAPRLLINPVSNTIAR
ncbi:MAG: hypothetical protein ACEQSK_19710, partial [Sphingomonadaceae bacterium]